MTASSTLAPAWKAATSALRSTAPIPPATVRGRVRGWCPPLREGIEVFRRVSLQSVITLLQIVIDVNREVWEFCRNSEGAGRAEGFVAKQSQFPAGPIGRKW